MNHSFHSMVGKIFNPTHAFYVDLHLPIAFLTLHSETLGTGQG